jgi:hypothetical protein
MLHHSINPLNKKTQKHKRKRRDQGKNNKPNTSKMRE